MSMEILDLRGSALEADLKAYGWRQHISRAADDDREGIWVYLPDEDEE